MTKVPQPNRLQEIEIKIKLEEQTYRAIGMLFPVERQPVRQENFFFDTEDYTLLRQHWGLRIRKEETAYYLTAKGPAEKNTSVYIRPEFETQLEQSVANTYMEGFMFSALPPIPGQELRKRFGKLSVKPIFSFCNLRQFLKFEKWIIELDRSVIKDQVFYELELETNMESVTECEQKLREMFASHGWNYEASAESKMKKAVRIFLNIKL